MFCVGRRFTTQNAIAPSNKAAETVAIPIRTRLFGDDETPADDGRLPSRTSVVSSTTLVGARSSGWLSVAVPDPSKSPFVGAFAVSGTGAEYSLTGATKR